MARHFVYEMKKGGAPFAVDVQADLFSNLATRVVIPLIPYIKSEKQDLPRLKPVLKIKGKSYVLVTTDLAAINPALLGKQVANLAHESQTITNALDFLMQGF